MSDFLLLRALRDPASLAALSEAQWDLLLRQAFGAGLLGRIGLLVQDLGERVPLPVRHAMQAMLTLVEQQQRAVRWELHHLQKLLAELPGPVVLLKGAAYAAADLPAARGRMFSDIDILVPRERIEACEAALMLGGWVSESKSAYDQRYYRQWMHELPPMTQLRRGSCIDVHHRLLPLTARIQTPPEAVLAQAERLEPWPRFSIPQALDRILHSACHLFHEGEWAHGLRDLSDLDLLLRAELGARGEALWPQLLERAAQLNLSRPLYYALRHAQQLLGTPVPDAVIARCPGRPAWWARGFVDGLLRRGLLSAHASGQLWGSGPALFLLYVRSHYLRMPLHLLLPHLLTKAWRGWLEQREAERLAKEKEAIDAQFAQADAAANLRGPG